MEVTRIRALRGPNLWTRSTAIEAIVLCDEAECDIATFTGFTERLRALYPHVPALAPTAQGIPHSLAHVLEVVTLSLQAQASCPVTFSRTAPAPDRGVFQVIVEYSEEAVGRLALEAAGSARNMAKTHQIWWNRVKKGKTPGCQCLSLGHETLQRHF